MQSIEVPRVFSQAGVDSFDANQVGGTHGGSHRRKKREHIPGNWHAGRASIEQGYDRPLEEEASSSNVCSTSGQLCTVRQSKRIVDHCARCEPKEPQCLMSASVGIFVGRLTLTKLAAGKTALILLSVEAFTGMAADVKGDFHDNQFDGKHCENRLNLKHLLRLMKSSPTLETMAMPLNHSVCGGICGGERRALWPA